MPPEDEVIECLPFHCMRLRAVLDPETNCHTLVVTMPDSPTLEVPVILEKCLCDTIDEGGTITVNSFIRVTQVVDGSLIQLGDFLPDLSAPYVVQGTVGDCCAVGDPAMSVMEVVNVTNTTWSSLPATTQSVTVIATSVGNPATPPTLNSAPLLLGVQYPFNKSPDTVALSGPFSIVAGVDDNVAVLITKVGA